jgi:hypothetical protein
MDFTSQDSQEIMKKFKSIIGSRLEKLNDEKGADGELYAYSIAVSNQKKKKEKESAIEEPMDKETKLKEMIQAALSKPLDEKKKPSSFTPQYDDKFNDKRKDLPDGLQKAILKKQGNLDEDMDLGHEDDEPHMLKADLYRIGKYAMELYKMVDQFEGEQEVDFPHWWQAKIINAKSCLVAAKHYLDFELKEPQIDAMVGVASEEGAINERDLPAGEEKIVKGIKKSGDFKKNDPSLYAIARSVYNKKKAKDKIKEAIIAKLQESEGEYAKIEKEIADLKLKGKTLRDPEMVKLVKRRGELEKSKK